MRREADYIAQPVRSLQSMLRVLAKVDSSLSPVVPDGLYGEDTEKAVTAFQKKYALPTTGQTDNLTWNMIVNSFAQASPPVLPAEPLRIDLEPFQTISAGEKNLHLHMMQGMLTAISSVYADFPSVSVTGVNDAQTQAAVKWLQALSSLPETGAIDHTTWLYLSRLYTISVGNGKDSCI